MSQPYMLTTFVYITATLPSLYLFFFNAPATTEIYTLSLHDALPICSRRSWRFSSLPTTSASASVGLPRSSSEARSEEHTSELQSPDHLVCRLLLEKKNTLSHSITTSSSLIITFANSIPRSTTRRVTT